jgi:hypothetical protein
MDSMEIAVNVTGKDVAVRTLAFDKKKVAHCQCQFESVEIVFVGSLTEMSSFRL